MAIAVTLQKVIRALREKKLYLILTPSGNYVTGGDTVDLSAIALTAGQPLDGKIGYPGIIFHAEVCSLPAGYVAVLVPGATLNAWKIQFWSAGAQVAAGAYPAALTAGTVIISVEGVKGQL